MILYGLIQIPSIQTYIVGRVAKTLSKDLNSTVTVENVKFRFFNRLELGGVLVKDRHKDTLLYAQTLRADVTDWFLFKDKIEIKNVELDNSIVNIHRKDSIWNFQYLIDYFSNPDTTKKKSDIVVDAKQIHFNSISFLKKDEWIGQDMGIWLKKMDLYIQSFDVQRKQLFIESIALVQPRFSQNNYKGLKPPSPDLTAVLEKIPIVSAFQWNKNAWFINVKAISLNDGSLMLDKYTERNPLPNQFDGQHIQFSSINGSLKDITFVNDTLRVNADLTAAERSGLLIKKLKSQVKFTPEIMEFNQLDLQTNNSKLGPYYAMRYKAFTNDFSNFLTDVELMANIRNSTLYTDDLSFFAPGLKNMKRVLSLNGNAKGSVADFTLSNANIVSGNTRIVGDVTMKGLPDIENTYIQFNSKNSQTTYEEIAAIAPGIRKASGVSLKDIGHVNFVGNFSGFIRDFNIVGNANTSLGRITTDLNLKLPPNGIPSYNGTVSSPGFNLGRFLKRNDVGIVALNGTVEGIGFAINDLDAHFAGNISRADYNGYTYRNISVDTRFKKRILDYNIIINDPNLQVPSLAGTLDLGQTNTGIKVNTALRSVNLRQLGFTKENMVVSGIYDLDFKGKNIDDFLGKAVIHDAVVVREGRVYRFNYLNLNSTYEEGRKILSLESNELSAQLEGRFKLAELDDAFKKFLSRYYPTYITEGRQNISDQNFIFTIKTNHFEDYAHLIHPKLGGLNNSFISGNLNLEMNDLSVTADVPEVSFDGKTFNNVRLLSNGDLDTLHADLLIGNAQFKDSFYFPSSSVNLIAYQDVSRIKLKTSANKTLNDAELEAAVQNLPDGIRVHFFPSQFVLNGKQWTLAKDGEITVRRNLIDANEVKFESGNQQIVVTSVLDDLTDGRHLEARIRNVALEDFVPLAFTNPKLAGFLTGTATLRNPYNRPEVDFEGVVDSLNVNTQNVGSLYVDGNYNTASKLMRFRANASEAQYDFVANGTYNLADSSLSHRLNIDVDAKRLNLKVLYPYLSTLFSDVGGLANGQIKIYGTGQRMFITGDANLPDAFFTVAYTQCKYLLQNQVIKFREDMIDFGILTIRDTLNNQGTASGKLHHKFFKEFIFDNLKFETNKLLVLNTTKKDNVNFYGKVIGRANMSVTGNASNIVMNISGEPSILDSSHIYLPTADTRESAAIDYIDFIQYGELMRSDSRFNQSTNILVNLDLIANPSCQVDVILDEVTGDILEGRGHGRLNITVGTREPLSIRGRYDVTQGNYTFSFQTFLKKPFSINSGYISWNGDPFLAQIDLNAEYLAKNVDISSLTLNSNLRQREDILITAHLTGVLTKPDIAFAFELPEKSEFRRDYLVSSRLDNFKYDQNSMNKQVASLLLFNSFILDNQNFLSQQNTLALATNTVGGVISNWLTTMLNNELEKATKGVISTYIDINPNWSLQTTANQLQANVRAGLKILLTSRINLLLGGNLDYNNPYAQLDRNIFTPDITIEWLLNADGSLRVVGFTRTGYDITNERRNRSGVQLSYRKDFNKFAELFRSRKPTIAHTIIPSTSLRLVD